MAAYNPRRRPRHVDTPPLTPRSGSPEETLSDGPTRTGMMILHKGATFHAPSTPPAESTDPVFGARSFPRRSLTNLMDVVEDAARRKERISAFIGSFDRDFSETGSTGSRRHGSLIGQFSFSAEESRQGMMTGATSAMNMSEGNGSRLSALVGLHEGSDPLGTRDRQRVKHHTSDSGIGSTVSDTILTLDHDDNGHKASKNHSSKLVSDFLGNPILRAPSSTTRSGSLVPAAMGESLQGISSDGMQQIEKRILHPLSRTQSLKDFQPLIHDIPRRIDRKEILCLRDLEKALVYLAPVSEFTATEKTEVAHLFRFILKASAKSADTYLHFCETWIHCFHTTVDHLSEQDQRRPTDAPYTNGYFLDLVEQVRNYAREMAASRQRQAAGEPAEEMDYSPSERLVLDGGLSQTGRPAQLVRVKDGKSVPIGPDALAQETHTRVYKEGASPSLMKRTRSEQSEDDSVHRSMARRRKLGPGEMVSAAPPQRCQECDREFKRPCDLTKHEKTHSRPWKCSEVGCKYHTYGWPTETERDRHVNDKHSADPAMYNCQFAPCTYKSKRESNCKQHMEKAHGWTYVRAKGVGKKKGKTASPRVPESAMQNLGSSGITPPMTRDPSRQNGQSPLGQLNTASGLHINEEVGDDAIGDVVSSRGSLDMSFFNDYPHVGLNIFNNSPHGSVLSGMSPHNLGTSSVGPSLPSSFSNHQGFYYGSGILPNTHNTQLLTPVLSSGRRPSGPLFHSPDQDISGMFDPSPAQPMANFSPSGQADLMLYTPHSDGVFRDDEGFEDFPPQTTRPTQDFALYPSHDPTLVSTGETGEMFPALPSGGSWTGDVEQQASGSGESQVPGLFTDWMQMDSQPEI